MCEALIMGAAAGFSLSHAHCRGCFRGGCAQIRIQELRLFILSGLPLAGAWRGSLLHRRCVITREAGKGGQSPRRHCFRLSAALTSLIPQITAIAPLPLPLKCAPRPAVVAVPVSGTAGLEFSVGSEREFIRAAQVRFSLFPVSRSFQRGTAMLCHGCGLVGRARRPACSAGGSSC